MAQLNNMAAMIYIAAVDSSGVLLEGAAFRHLGEAYPFSISFPLETTKFFGGTIETDNAVLGSVETAGEPKGSLTLYDVTAEHVAMALNADLSSVDVSAETLTDLSVTMGNYGDYVEIGKEHLTSATITSMDGLTTYVKDIDYKINPALGLLMPLRGGGIAEDATIKLSGSVAARQDIPRLDLKSVSSKLYAIKLEWRNRITGHAGTMELYCVRLSSKAELAAASADSKKREELQFDVAPQIPVGGSSYGVLDGLPLRAGA